MEPTIHKNHIVFINKWQYRASPPKRDDIVLVRPIKDVFEKGSWIHRVIAIEGDILEISGELVTVNQHKALFPYLSTTSHLKIQIPKGFVFQKGDNPNTLYGLIPIEAIEGKVIGIL